MTDHLAERHKDLGRLMEVCGVHNDGLATPAELFDQCLERITLVFDALAEVQEQTPSILHALLSREPYVMRLQIADKLNSGYPYRQKLLNSIS